MIGNKVTKRIPGDKIEYLSGEQYVMSTSLEELDWKTLGKVVGGMRRDSRGCQVYTCREADL